MIWSSELGVSTVTVCVATPGAAAELVDDVVDEALEVGIDVEERRERLADAADPLGQQPHPFARREDDRGDRDIGDGQEQDHAEEGGERRRHAPPLQPFEHRHQRDRDHQGGGDRQEEFGAGAQRERQGEQQARARRSAPARRAAGRGGRRWSRSPARRRAPRTAAARRASAGSTAPSWARPAPPRLSDTFFMRGQCPRRGPLRSGYSAKSWCPWPESNGHSLRNSILSRARLPIPPQGHGKPAL